MRGRRDDCCCFKSGDGPAARASATKDRAAARDAAESLRRARLDLDRAVAARKDAEADAASSRADADDLRKQSEADRRACVALEATCRDLGASDVDITAARAPRRTVPEAVRAHREVCGLVCALVVLLDPAPVRVGVGLGALGVLALMCLLSALGIGPSPRNSQKNRTRASSRPRPARAWRLFPHRRRLPRPRSIRTSASSPCDKTRDVTTLPKRHRPSAPPPAARRPCCTPPSTCGDRSRRPRFYSA